MGLCPPSSKKKKRRQIRQSFAFLLPQQLIDKCVTLIIKLALSTLDIDLHLPQLMV